MSDDKDSKTAEASEKKISDALEKGDVPHSREAPLFASLVGILVVLTLLLHDRIEPVVAAHGRFMDEPRGVRLESSGDVIALLSPIALIIGTFLLPIIAVIAIAGLAASLFQNMPRLVLERIRPQWSRISPMAGWKRLFGSQGHIEFLKSFFKFITVTLLVAVMLHWDQYSVINAMFSDPALIPSLMLTIATRLVSGLCVATIVLVALDLVWAQLRWRNNLRMSHQEVKEEFRQAEGDPLVKARLRSLAKDRARQRMIDSVPRATVVIANPTHYAIALRHDRKMGGAPMVVAKGTDLVALRIREIAERHAIPVIEDRALARAMHAAVEVDQWIPTEFYRAVAQILYFVYSRDRHAPNKQ